MVLPGLKKKKGTGPPSAGNPWREKKKKGENSDISQPIAQGPGFGVSVPFT